MHYAHLPLSLYYFLSVLSLQHITHPQEVRRRIARNRWFLVYTLLNNPTLRRHRKEAGRRRQGSLRTIASEIWRAEQDRLNSSQNRQREDQSTSSTSSSPGGAGSNLPPCPHCGCTLEEVAAAEERDAEATAKADEVAAKAAAEAVTSSELHAARRNRGHRRCPSGCDEELADLTLPGPSPTLARPEVRDDEARMQAVPMVPMGRSAEQRHVTLRLGSAFSSTCATPPHGNAHAAVDETHVSRPGVYETTLYGVGDTFKPDTMRTQRPGPPFVAAPALTGQRDVAVELSQAAAALQRIVNEEQRQAMSISAANSATAAGVGACVASDGPSCRPQTAAFRADQAAGMAHLQQSSAPPTLLCPPSASQLLRRRSAKQLEKELQSAKEVHPSLKSELPAVSSGSGETGLSGRDSLNRSTGRSSGDRPRDELDPSGDGLNLDAVNGTMSGVSRIEPAADVGETCVDDQWTQAPDGEDMSPWVSAQVQPTWPAHVLASAEPQGDRDVRAAPQMNASSNTTDYSSLTKKNGSGGGVLWTGSRDPAPGLAAGISPSNAVHADTTPKASRESRLVHADSAPAAPETAVPLRKAKTRTSHLHRFSSEPARAGMRFSTNIKFVPGHSRLPSFEPDLALLMEEAEDARAKSLGQVPTVEYE